MRKLRNFKANRCYHLISRIAHRAYYLADDEKTIFVNQIWKVAAFSGVEVLAYCVMSNHFHILVYVPNEEEISDEELFRRLRSLYRGEQMEEIEKEWNEYVRLGYEEGKEAFRKRYLRRMWNASEFMKTLKQYLTMSYNCRHAHSGTMWESRFRVKEYMPDDKATLMNVAGYIDRNPLKAKLVTWPDQYDWCSFAAASKGDKRSIDGYCYIYSVFVESPWETVKELHEMSIHLVYKELTEEALGASARKGLSIDEERKGKALERSYAKFEAEDLPLCIPNILDKGNNKVAIDLLKILNEEGKKKPSELREALAINSSSFFTKSYLTPLEEKGLIKISDNISRFSPTKTFEITSTGKHIIHKFFAPH